MIFPPKKTRRGNRSVARLQNLPIEYAIKKKDYLLGIYAQQVSIGRMNL